MPETSRKNEFEIASDYISALTKLAADQAARFANLAASAAPPIGKYSIGDFILNQMQNSTKLLETFVEAGKSFGEKSRMSADDKAAKTADAPAKSPPRRRRKPSASATRAAKP